MNNLILTTLIILILILVFLNVPKKPVEEPELWLAELEVVYEWKYRKVGKWIY